MRINITDFSTVLCKDTFSTFSGVDILMLELLPGTSGLQIAVSGCEKSHCYLYLSTLALWR